MYDVVRTQIRLNPLNAKAVKGYAERHGMSMNQALNNLIASGLIQDESNIDSAETRAQFEADIVGNFKNLSMSQLKSISNLVVEFANENIKHYGYAKFSDKSIFDINCSE